MTRPIYEIGSLRFRRYPDGVRCEYHATRLAEGVLRHEWDLLGVIPFDKWAELVAVMQPPPTEESGEVT